MQDAHENLGRTWRLLIAAAAAISLLQTPLGGQTTTKAPQTKPSAQATPVKPSADNLPDLPADLATKLKPVGNGRVFVVAAPRAQAAPRASVRPPGRQPSGGSLPRLACIHNTVYYVTAEYPVLICHPWTDDIRATTTGTFTLGAAATSGPRRPTSALQPAAAPSYRVRSSGIGPMACSYARMPVVATLQKRNVTCENPNAFVYDMDIAGVGLHWTGDPEMRPADLRLFDEPSCVSDHPTSCSGASTCTPLCGSSGGPSPTPVPPPPLR
jgi:hypothetical protein